MGLRSGTRSARSKVETLLPWATICPPAYSEARGCLVSLHSAQVRPVRMSTRSGRLNPGGMASIASVTIWRVWSISNSGTSKNYRYETGCLDLVAANPTKIHSRGIGDLPNRWAWRFYLPQGHQYRLLISTGAIPDDEFPDPKGSSSRTLSPGEYVLYAYAEPTRNGKWRLHSEVLDRGMFAGGRGAVEDDIPPLNRGFHTGPADLCPEEAIVEPDSKLLLLRCEIDDDAEASPKLPEGHADGFVIWIEEVK